MMQIAGVREEVSGDGVRVNYTYCTAIQGQGHVGEERNSTLGGLG